MRDTSRHNKLEWLFRDLDGCMVDIQEHGLPGLEMAVHGIEEAVKAAWKISYRLQNELGLIKKRDQVGSKKRFGKAKK